MFTSSGRKRDYSMLWSAPVQPRFIPRSQLSRTALTKALLGPDELDRVCYDEKHNWHITALMCFMPSWGMTHDARPEMSVDTRYALKSPVNEFVHRAYEALFTVCETLVLLSIIGGTSFVLFSVFYPHYRHFDLYAVMVIIAAAVACVLWGKYVIGLSERYRVILTYKRMIVVVDQLPWRDESYVAIPWERFNEPTFYKSWLGKRLGYIDVLIRTKEQEEPVPLMIRMPNGDSLSDALRWFTNHEHRLPQSPSNPAQMTTQTFTVPPSNPQPTNQPGENPPSRTAPRRR